MDRFSLQSPEGYAPTADPWKCMKKCVEKRSMLSPEGYATTAPWLTASYHTIRTCVLTGKQPEF
jgi:hypothetical protein